MVSWEGAGRNVSSVVALKVMFTNIFVSPLAVATSQLQRLAPLLASPFANITYNSLGRWTCWKTRWAWLLPCCRVNPALFSKLSSAIFWPIFRQ